MNHSFSATPYQSAFKIPAFILAGLSILTIASFFVLSISFIPLILSSLLLTHAIVHILIKNLLTFKATDLTVLSVNDESVTFKTDENIHWELKTNNIKDIVIDQPKYSIIINTKDDDSYSVAKYCFNIETAEKIKASL